MKALLHFQKKILAASIISLIATSNALATDGIFITLDTGLSKESGLPSPEAIGATSADNNLTPLALRVSIGYNHDLASYLGLGLNVGLGQYGNYVYHYDDGDTTTVKSQTLEILALITTHIQKFDLIGKIGGVRQKTLVTGLNAPDDSHHNNPEAAIELAYNFSPRFAATATYAHVYGGTPKDLWSVSHNSVSLDEYLIGLRYTFASS